MKKLTVKLLILFAFFTNLNGVHAQFLNVVADGGNKVAWIGERIGLTDVTIRYNRPGVKQREGKIWGSLIPVGFAGNGFGNARVIPWRAGANESTNIEFSTQVNIEGHLLPAGKYGFYIAYDSLGSTLIFSKDHSSWGSFFYDSTQDILRVKVMPKTTTTSVEWMQFQIFPQSDSSAIIELQWEKKVIPFHVTVDLTALQLASFRKELQTEKGFTYESWVQAAWWCAQHNTNLEQALRWTDSATSQIFYGDLSFQSWSTRALVLYRLGRKEEAVAAVKRGLPAAGMMELYRYAWQLREIKMPKEALEINKINYEKYPKDFFTAVGMAEAYSIQGDYKTALEYARIALPEAPDAQNKSYVESIINTLEQGKDFLK